jgi:hypothetical protein
MRHDSSRRACAAIGKWIAKGHLYLAVVPKLFYTTDIIIFVFMSTRDRQLLGFTADQAGGDLPQGCAPWEPATEGGAVLVGGDTGPVSEAVRRDGVFLAVGGYEDESSPNPLIH